MSRSANPWQQRVRVPSGLDRQVRRCGCCTRCEWIQGLDGVWRCPYGGPYIGFQRVAEDGMTFIGPIDRRTTAIEDANRVVRGQPGYVWSKPPEPDGAA